MATIQRETRTASQVSAVKMNMNVEVPNSVPSYHKMSVEEYMENLEKTRLEQEKGALRDQQQGARKSISKLEEIPLSAKSNSPRERPNSHSDSRPEVRRLSGNFNAPTYVEVERHNATKSPRGFRGTIKGWMKRLPPSTVA